jgi:hypothetical protein
LNYWRDKLAVHRLHPTEVDGRAEMMLSACDARFKGIRFRELSISVFVAREPHSHARDGALLLRAFNSIRFFAWVERTLFSTPYYPSQVAVSPIVPAFLRLGEQDHPILAASMGHDGSDVDIRANAPLVPDGWQGPILLPDRRDLSLAAPRQFFASLTGDTQTLAFDSQRDTFQLGPPASDPIVPLLVAARFEPNTWILRTAATHGKSKTIRRTEGDEFAGFADGRPIG